MNTRIQQFLQTEQIAPSKLADTLGVQRSNISHILIGRNKPSFDFIEKMLKKYPQISPDWLILGKGEMYRGVYRNSSIEPDLFSNNALGNKPEVEDKAPISDKQFDTANNEQQTVMNSEPLTRKIVRVMLFYNDNTFETYNPS